MALPNIGVLLLCGHGISCEYINHPSKSPSPAVVFPLFSAFYTCISLSGTLEADCCTWSMAEGSSGEWIFVVVVWNVGL